MKLPVNYNNLTPQERKKVREKYIEMQKGMCAHCKEPLKSKAHKSVMSKRINKKLFPDNFFNWPVHLHHCHKTGLTIGAVHCHCNAVLWQYYGK